LNREKKENIVQEQSFSPGSFPFFKSLAGLAVFHCEGLIIYLTTLELQPEYLLTSEDALSFCSNNRVDPGVLTAQSLA
jgi:hypothetical protein